MTRERSDPTILLFHSGDVAGSVGRSGYLEAHLRRIDDSGPVIDVRHLPGGRVDTIAQRFGSESSSTHLDVPADLESWYASATAPIELPETASLAIMSLADVVAADVWRHRTEGVLVTQPSDSGETWTDRQLAWLHEHFEPDPPTDDEMESALRSVADQLAAIGCDLVVFNISTVIPDEKVYWFRPDEPETTSVRAARANLVLDRLASEVGVALVDVDRVTAELGAGTAVVGAASYSEEALDALSEEAIGVILDLEGISEIFASDAMQLIVPRYDRRTTTATLTRWHVATGAEIEKGDILFDLRFGNLRAQLTHDRRRTDKAMEMSIVAGRCGYVASTSADIGASVTVGDRIGVVTSAPDVEWNGIDDAVRFPVGIRLKARDDD